MDLLECDFCKRTFRAKTKALIGGGGVYSYIRVLPDEFLLKSTVMTTDFKRNSSGRTRIYEYTPPPPINALVSALRTFSDKFNEERATSFSSFLRSFENVRFFLAVDLRFLESWFI